MTAHEWMVMPSSELIMQIYILLHSFNGHSKTL